MESLAPAKIPFAVGSSTPRENIEAVVEGAGLGGLFNNIVAAEDVVKGKPDPEVFLKAAELIGVVPERCIVFEDSLSGIEAALAGGMRVVGMTTSNDRELLEKSGASLVKDSFEGLSLNELVAILDGP